MAYEIKIPRLGWTMDDGVFVDWLKHEGDRVSSGDALFTLEGDKVVEEVRAPGAGVLHIPHDAPCPGDRVLAGATIAFVMRPGENQRDLPDIASARRSETRSSRRSSRAGAPRATPSRRGGARALPGSPAPSPGSPRSDSLPRHPAAARAASMLGATLDAGELVRLRRETADGALDDAAIESAIVLAVAGRVMRADPRLRARPAGGPEAGDGIDIVVTTRGGSAPTLVRSADRTSIAELARRLSRLASSAHDGALGSESGDTDVGLVVLALGASRIDRVVPVVPDGKLAALGVGRVREASVVRGGVVRAGHLLEVSLAVEVSAVDFDAAESFLSALVRGLEAPREFLASRASP